MNPGIYFDRIRRYLRKNAVEETLCAIGRKTAERCGGVSGKKQRILFAMSFSIYEPCRVHDFLLAQSLRLRGAEIVPLICGKAQTGECNVFGGIWGGYTGDGEKDRAQSAKNCGKCLGWDRKLWEKWAGISPVSLADHLSPEDVRFIDGKLGEFRDGEHRQWRYEGMPVGQWAVDVLINNDMVGDENLVEGRSEKLRHHLRNILVLAVTVEKVLKNVRPDAIVSNDSFYYQWAVVERLAGKLSIPFYSTWQGGRRTGWCYAMGEPAMNLNMKPAWDSWKVRALDRAEEERIDEFLGNRRTGGAMVLNTADPRANSGKLEDAPALDSSKPTALLAANVIWDLAALNKEVQFGSMIEWIVETIAFFREHPEWQLIVKAHPGEENRKLPRTRQQIEPEIRKAWPELPGNVIFIPPRSRVSVYDLMDKVRVGLVYTTTVGLEMACSGIPVVTAGRSHYHGMGFTYDTESKERYFEVVRDLLGTPMHQRNAGHCRELARKFFGFYFFRYYSSLDFFDAGFGEEFRLHVRSIEDLSPGSNPVLDHVCDSILGHNPIIEENRWPPLGKS